MHEKQKESGVVPSSGNVSTAGSGKVSVSVKDIVQSPKVQRQVEAVKEIVIGQSKSKSE